MASALWTWHLLTMHFAAESGGSESSGGADDERDGVVSCSFRGEFQDVIRYHLSLHCAKDTF